MSFVSPMFSLVKIELVQFFINLENKCMNSIKISKKRMWKHKFKHEIFFGK